MKKVKTSIICALIVVSVMAGIPTYVAATGGGGPGAFIIPTDPAELAVFPEQMFGALGNIFGMLASVGPSGRSLGEVFKILFTNIFEFQFVESEINHVYQLSAFFNDTKIYEVSHEGNETYWIWEDKYPTTGIGPNEHPYLRISRTGNATITHSSGAAIVFIIWDNNDSFIKALNKVIFTAQNVHSIIMDAGDPSTWSDEKIFEIGSYIAGEVLSAITYLFFHINDIISGDELLIMNMITWEQYSMDTTSDYAVDKTWYLANDWNLNDDAPLGVEFNGNLTNWDATATGEGDEYMKWLLAPPEAGIINRQWSRLSFNLIELWFKTFQININVSAIVEAVNNAAQGGGDPFEGVGLARVFHGLDIEIYLMTHSLLGFVAYDDFNANNIPDVNRTIVAEGNVESEIITGSEAEYWFALGNVGGFEFLEPELVDHNGKPGYKWSIRLTNVDMLAVPIGMSPSDVAAPVFDNLDYLELGFTFAPSLSESVDTDGYDLVPEYEEVQMASGIIKLDQYFDDWNNGAPINPVLAGLDFAVIYVSTILHFRLHFEVNDIEVEVGQNGLVNSSDPEVTGNVQANGTIKIGDYTGDLPVAAVDIAGPEYNQTVAGGGASTTHPASTTTIPLAFLTFDASANMRYEDPGAPQQSFEAGGFIAIESAILIYAVSYPTFDGTGDGIWHDPTFSVFMTWDNPGFWAVILVVAGISLVAVAAILITRRKNRV
jgi:hypothetical protein